jgi:hypothetical protein
MSYVDHAVLDLKRRAQIRALRKQLGPERLLLGFESKEVEEIDRAYATVEETEPPQSNEEGLDGSTEGISAQGLG